VVLVIAWQAIDFQSMAALRAVQASAHVRPVPMVTQPLEVPGSVTLENRGCESRVAQALVPATVSWRVCQGPGADVLQWPVPPLMYCVNADAVKENGCPVTHLQ
jgi:hypothetical protein